MYETVPMARIGATPNAPAGPNRDARVPATSAAPVPSTGMSAAGAREARVGAEGEEREPDRGQPAPTPTSAATHGARRRPSRTASARKPPTASSHARVGSEKNAHGWFAVVR